MKVNKLLIGAFATLTIFLAACGNDNKTVKDDLSKEHVEKPIVKTEVKDRNKEGQLIDKAGHLITGCPGHREMVGSSGDMCPKCDYMTMIPITWDIAGVDTVRVTTLADYNPPADKQKK